MPVCEGCAASYDDTFKFCPQCGRAKPEPKKIAIEVEVKGRASEYDCPLCGDSSAIQKVSAIVDGSTHVTQGSSTSSGSAQIYSERTGGQVGSAVSSTTTSSYQKSQSSLAQKLTLPPAPVKPEASSFEVGGVVTTGIGIGMYVVGLFLGYSIVKVFQTHALGEFLIVWFCLAPLLGGGAAAVLVLILNQLNGSQEKYQAALADYEKDARIYEYACAKWNELYYCHKHAVAYSLSGRKPVPADEAIERCFQWAVSQQQAAAADGSSGPQ